MASGSRTTTTLNPPRLRRTDPSRRTHLVRLDLRLGALMRRSRDLDQLLNWGGATITSRLARGFIDRSTTANCSVRHASGSG